MLFTTSVSRLLLTLDMELVMQTTANWEVLTIHSHERHKGDFDLTPTFFNDDQWNYGWQLVAVLKNKRTSPCS